jgi:hypothetical protein
MSKKATPKPTTDTVLTQKDWHELGDHMAALEGFVQL